MALIWIGGMVFFGLGGLLFKKDPDDAGGINISGEWENVDQHQDEVPSRRYAVSDPDSLATPNEVLALLDRIEGFLGV
jgi:hypothetical protein